MIDVTIEKLVHGGAGLARHEGLPLFISGAIPGERARVEITRKRRDFAEARLVEILESSPDRVSSPLREEESTGAHWAHIVYPAQLRFKEEILLETVRRTGGTVPETALPIIAAGITERYRLRAQFKVADRNGKPVIGFHREGTHEVVEVRNHILLHPLLDRTLEALRLHANLLPPLEEVHLLAAPKPSRKAEEPPPSEGEEVLILLFSKSKTPPDPAPLFDAVKAVVPEVIGIVACAEGSERIAAGRHFLTFSLEGITLRATERNFFQAHWEQNEKMVRTVLDLAGLTGVETVLDLYSGIGNFTLPLARHAAKVTGIEAGYSAVRDAERNAKANGIQNVKFIPGDVNIGLNAVLKKKKPVDLIVLDPPREGVAPDVLQKLIRLSPDRILYVSCNPATLARDIRALRENGYTLRRLQPVDLFPQTHHIEAIGEMVKESQPASV